MAKYRAALIGCGWVSGEHIRAYKNNPLTEVVALASLTKDEAQAKADECGLAVPCYDSLDEMLEKEKPHILSVTSRPDFHVEHAIKAAEKGVHLVLEKPIALNLDELRRLVECVAKHRTQSIVSFVLRWNPLFTILRALLDDGAVGDLFYGEVDYY
ncbi:MAG: Gfo/Idh/MocA family oxidoreductase, partial [Candidatus Omnitrophota bacterium]